MDYWINAPVHVVQADKNIVVYSWDHTKKAFIGDTSEHLKWAFNILLEAFKPLLKLFTQTKEHCSRCYTLLENEYNYCPRCGKRRLGFLLEKREKTYDEHFKGET